MMFNLRNDSEMQENRRRYQVTLGGPSRQQMQQSVPQLRASRLPIATFPLQRFHRNVSTAMFPPRCLCGEAGRGKSRNQGRVTYLA